MITQFLKKFLFHFYISNKNTKLYIMTAKHKTFVLLLSILTGGMIVAVPLNKLFVNSVDNVTILIYYIVGAVTILLGILNFYIFKK